MSRSHRVDDGDRRRIALAATQQGELSDEDRSKLIDYGAEAIIRMLYKDGFFHADLHPGNLLILSDGRIGFIDLFCEHGNSAVLNLRIGTRATGRRDKVSIFGTDYPTPDGSGLRDYIHVEDLATAHLDALTYLRGGGESTTLNCGYGHGYSVRDILAAVARANGAPRNITEEPRRAGDPPELIAVAKKIRAVLGWSPQFDDLDTIVSTSLAWERKIADQDPTAYWAA